MRCMARMTQAQAEAIMRWLDDYAAREAQYGVDGTTYAAWSLARHLCIRPVNARHLVARARELTGRADL
jgi:hypothetical protein